MKNNLATSAAVVAAVVIVVVTVAVVRSARTYEAPDAAVAVRTSANAEAASSLPKMIDLGADKCIPCIRMAPILAELKEEYAGRAEIIFIDVWKSPDAGRQYGIRVIPTQIFFDREGREVWRHEGFLGRDEIVARLRELGAG